MRIRNYQQLARDYKLDAKKTSAALKEQIDGGDLKLEHVSIRKLAEHLVEDGAEWVRTMDPRFGNGDFVESMDAVNTTHFANITGQFAYSAIMENFNNPEFVFSGLIPTVETQFSGERIPGVTMLGDGTEVVNEGSQYPTLGVTQDYVDTPPTIKRGGIVPVTKEAIFFDRTNLVAANCADIGGSLGLNKEKRAIDCVIDENTTAHRHKWRAYAAHATYGDASTTSGHYYDNLSASTPLTDYTSIDTVEQLLANMTDPNTGEPITVMADTLIVTPQLMQTARRVINATQIVAAIGGFPTSGNPIQTTAGNLIGNSPYSANYNILTSRLLAARLGTDTSWFLGNPKKAFVYMQNWGITVAQAPTNSHLEFQNDIVMQFKASERGAYFVRRPQYMAKATA